MSSFLERQFYRSTLYDHHNLKPFPTYCLNVNNPVVYDGHEASNIPKWKF